PHITTLRSFPTRRSSDLIELLMEAKLVRRHQFGEQQAHYEKSYFDKQHDHIILSDTGEVIEFCDPRIQSIKATIEEIFNIKVERDRKSTRLNSSHVKI